MQTCPKFRRLVLGPAVPGGTCSFGFSGGADRTSSAAANSSRNVGAKSYAVKTEPGARGQADPKQAFADQVDRQPPAADQTTLLSRLTRQRLLQLARANHHARANINRCSSGLSLPQKSKGRGQDRRALSFGSPGQYLAVQAGDMQTARAGPPSGDSKRNAWRPRPTAPGEQRLFFGCAKPWWGCWPLRDCHLGACR